MAIRKVSTLPPNVQSMHLSQVKWRTEAWGKTINLHKTDIEEQISKMDLLSIWSNCLSDYSNVTRKLIPEMFMDGYISIHFACMGLYRYANICLRSQLETTLRLIYYCRHSIEFDWWQKGNDWYRSALHVNNPWGDHHEYFINLDKVKQFDQLCNESQRLFGGASLIKTINARLSQFVHGGISAMQTNINAFSPRYHTNSYKRWLIDFKRVQSYMNILLILSFSDEFLNLSSEQVNKIINSGIESSHHKLKIKEVLNLP